jgi:hypothetical protein
MKSLLGAFFLCLCLVSTGHAWAIDLPSSCGDNNVQFEAKAKAGRPSPGAPATGKAQIILIENENQMIGLFMHATVRYGMDGAWVGANYGNSYFALTVDPGEHHLCANWKTGIKMHPTDSRAIAFTAQPDQVYYFAGKVTVESRDVITFDFAPLNDDEGKYQIQTLKQSTSKPK